MKAESPALCRACLTTREAAAFLNISRTTLLRMSHAGEVKFVLLRRATVSRSGRLPANCPQPWRRASHQRRRRKSDVFFL